MKTITIAYVLPEGMTGRMLRRIKGVTKLADIFPSISLTKSK